LTIGDDPSSIAATIISTGNTSSWDLSSVSEFFRSLAFSAILSTLKTVHFLQMKPSKAMSISLIFSSIQPLGFCKGSYPLKVLNSRLELVMIKHHVLMALAVAKYVSDLDFEVTTN
jgi:hypothetical protein